MKKDTEKSREKTGKHDNYIKAGVLTKIKYPTGGFSAFEYEANDIGYFNMPDHRESRYIYTDDYSNTSSLSFRLLHDQEVGINVSFFNDNCSDSAKITIKRIQIDNDTIVYSLTKQEAASASVAKDATDAVWLSEGGYVITLKKNLSTDIIYACLYDIKPHLYDQTYKIYDVESTPTHVQAGEMHFIDDSSYYCSNTFTITNNENHLINLKYYFWSHYYPSSSQGETYVRLKNSSGNVIYSDNFEDDPEYPTLKKDDHSVFEENTLDLYLNNGTYTIEFDPCVSFESGYIRVTYNSAQNISFSKKVGGLRIKTITTNDGSSQNNIVKRYRYNVDNDTTSSSGILHGYPLYYRIEEDFKFLAPTMSAESQISIYTTSQGNLGATSGGNVGYSEVTVDYNGSGKTVNKYTSVLDYPGVSNNKFPYSPPLTYEWKHGLLKESSQFDQEGRIKYEEMNFYNPLSDTLNRTFVPGIVAIQLGGVSSGATISKYLTMTGWNYQTIKVSSTYDDNGENPIVDTTLYYYDNPDHIQLTGTISKKSNGKTLITRNYYPLDFTNAITSSSDSAIKAIALMKADSLYMHNVLLEQQQLLVDGGDTTLISGNLTKYKEWDESQILPYQFYKLETDSPLSIYKRWNDSLTIDPHYSLISEINRYDLYGNLLQYQNEDKIPISFKWNYNDQYPVAKAVNAEYDEITGSTISSYGVPQDAQLTKFYYTPLVGITETKDVNGSNTYYDYDDYGRLILIKDNNENIVKRIKYNYSISNLESVASDSISASDNNIDPYDPVSLTVNGGSLGDGAKWKWYKNGCANTYIGEGTSIVEYPPISTTYYVRGEGLYNTTSCVNKTVTVKSPEIDVYRGTTPLTDGVSTYNIGYVTVNASDSVTFTIQNNGDNILDSISVSENSLYYQISSIPASQIQEDSTSTFNVRFSPVSEGLQTATVSIISNDYDENPFTFTLTGTGAYPEINVEQDTTDIPDGTGSYNVGNVDVDSSVVTTFTIQNLGNVWLDLGTVSENSSEYSIILQPLSDVSPNGSMTFSVRFLPTSAGVHSTTVTIPNSDPNKNPYDFTITGTGVAEEEINANFSYRSGNLPVKIFFTDTSTGSPTSWEWDFDNNGTTDSTSQNPTYIYPSGGTYHAKLTIHKGAQTDYIIKTIIIPI